MKYLIAACAILALSLVVIFYASASEVGDGFNGEIFRPVLEYHTVDISYTDLNKISLAAAIVGQSVDMISTSMAINNGGEEANPLYGSHPNYLVMGLIKASLIGGAYLAIEYLVSPDDRQIVRNWFYGSIAVIGGGAATWNMGQVLK